MYAILTTNIDGKYGLYGPFQTINYALAAQTVIDSTTDLDTEIVPMVRFNRQKFSIYS